ncbi:MAG: SDR family oxidoreductase [Rhodospirillaceae bacterium]|jgi:NAD(P)-dependent dehydrogenase (short-subunit alcohol dehydrogenase family)|nr:SDR family oxidoreductase [Rhodospirillaceae bacterium]MBT5665842.1 SDR family oxidoreductase [Rhodospirillaceae bacterium]MBT5810338.1 SDR family oxidoreductase [Rhodospirillaceae bacterium]
MGTSQFDLGGKVALITGGNGGIGLGMAEAIARAGGDVCIWGTNADKNAAALAQLEAHGGRAAAMLCDVSDEGAVEQCFADTVREFGRVDGCFANAGVSGSGDAVPFIDITTEAWRRVTSVNLDGAFFTLRAAARHMVERGGGGRLVGTASLAAISGAARNQHYAATKGGLISMLIALSVELARHEITANAILPGWIETAMTEKAIAWEKFSDNVKPRIPLGRWGEPADFGGIAAYIMSDSSAYHTGDTFLIDGGYQKF